MDFLPEIRGGLHPQTPVFWNCLNSMVVTLGEDGIFLPTVRRNPLTFLTRGHAWIAGRSASALAAAFMAVCIPVAAQQSTGGWEIAKYDGEDYISVESMKKFYGFTKLAKDGSKVTLENSKLLVNFNCGSQECTMNGVKFVFSRPVETINGKTFVSRIDLTKLVDPVLRPNFIKNAGAFRTVILDPGHGGKDAGATNSFGTEAGYNLTVARKAAALLKAAGYKALVTRNGDYFISLQERVNIANAVKEDAVFISVHFNSGSPNARGIETFTLSPPGVAHYGRGWKPSDSQQVAGNEHDSANIALATSVHGSMLRNLGKYTFDRGIKRARFSVLSGVRHPAILMEGGFITHSYDARLIASDSYQNALAKSIFEAVSRYRIAVGGQPIAAK